MEKSRKPKIRFKGFTDDWEQRKLIDVCDYVDYRGKTPTKTDSGVFLVTAKNVKDGYIDYGASQEYISEDDYEEVMRRGKTEIGDVLITTEAPCGNVAQVNRADIALAQRIIKYRGQSNIIDNTYLKYYLLSSEFQKILNAKSSGGTVKGIKGSVLHQQEIKYPKYEEQFKIGSYFNNLDNLITLHQRKLDKLINVKKSMLEKMFPQQGSKIPGIRFYGFTDAWEQRKCGDVLNERNIQHPQSEEFPLVSFTVENGVTSKTERYEREQLVRGSKEAKKYKETRLDDIVYNPANLKFGAIARNKLGNAVFSPIYVTYEVDKSLALPSFVEMFVTRNNFIQNALQYQQGTVYERMSVSTADFATLDITLPSLAEQKQIGQYFQQLDHLITLHQRKLEKLKNIKKSMLEKMFV